MATNPLSVALSDAVNHATTPPTPSTPPIPTKVQTRPDVRRGWTANSIAPNPDIHTAAQSTLASRVMGTTPSIASLSQGTTASDWVTNSPGLVDSTLGSRHYSNPGTGFRDVAATGSVYGQSDVPAFLQNAVNNLNQTQSLQASAHGELVNKILAGMQGGGSDEYLWAEALRAAAANPGAHLTFGQAVQNPLIGAGYNAAATGAGNLANTQAQAIQGPSTVNNQIAQLQQQQSSLNPTPFGQYEGSQQQQLDQQILGLKTQQAGATKIATAAAGARGWTPAMPTY